MVIRTTKAESDFNEGSVLLLVAAAVVIYATVIYYQRMNYIQNVRAPKRGRV